MNSFFEELGKKVTQTSQEAMKKTKDLAEIAKINAQMTDEEKKLKKLYMKLGQLYYEMYKEEPDSVFVDICQGIGGCLQTINRYETMVEGLKGIKRCQKCKTEILVESTYCPTCGQRLDDERETIVSTICPNCGMENGGFATSCIKCGGLL